jgi:hypothetical protein
MMSAIGSKEEHIGADDEKVTHWFVLTVALLLDPLAVALLLAASAGRPSSTAV